MRFYGVAMQQKFFSHDLSRLASFDRFGVIRTQDATPFEVLSFKGMCRSLNVAKYTVKGLYLDCDIK